MDKMKELTGTENQMSYNKKTSVLGIYKTRDSLEKAVDALIHASFHARDISVLLSENLGGQSMGVEKASKGPEGATTGAVSGAVLGGGLGLLAGIGAVAIPGLGPFIAAGPIMAALAGAGVGGTVGGVAGALVGLGIPEYEAKRYEGYLQKDGILLSVHCNTSRQISLAKEILEITGAGDISSTSESSIDRDQASKHFARPR